MKVKKLRTTIGADGVKSRKGTVVDVDDATARTWIERRIAVSLDVEQLSAGKVAKGNAGSRGQRRGASPSSLQAATTPQGGGQTGKTKSPSSSPPARQPKKSTSTKRAAPASKSARSTKAGS